MVNRITFYCEWQVRVQNFYSAFFECQLLSPCYQSDHYTALKERLRAAGSHGKH